MAPNYIPDRNTNTDDVCLVSAAYTAFQDIAKLLRTYEKDVQLKIFYAGLAAYCVMIRNHSNRVTQTSVEVDNEPIRRSLDLLASTIVPEPCTARIPAGTRLRDFIQHWDDVSKLYDDNMRLQIIQSSLDFGKTAEECNDFLLSLTTCEEELRIRYPEQPSVWMAEGFVPQKKIREPSYAVWQAAQAMFNALVSCQGCLCEPAHEFGARLCLGTYRQPPEMECDMAAEVEHGFEMFLSMKHEWHEARIRMAKESVVRFDEAPVQPQNKTRRGKVQSLRVKSLCETISKIKTMKAYRLELKVMREKLFKLKSERSEFLVDGATEPVPLEYFLKSGSRSFTERTRRILAVILSSAVLHLHDTPWLKPTWSSSDVLFLRTASSTIPLRPFLQTKLSSLEACFQHSAERRTCYDDDADGSGSDTFDLDDADSEDIDPDDLIQHQCPTLITLAIILIEVYFVTPFDVLAKKYGVLLDEEQQKSVDNRFVDANMVFEACRGEIPEDTYFHRAIEKCLDPEIWEDDAGDKLDRETLRSRIYEEVVRPLEIELSQAYSSISIDNLDKFARSLDFASWDQPVQDVDQRPIKYMPPDQLLSQQACTPSPETSSSFHASHLPEVPHCFRNQGLPDWPESNGRSDGTISSSQHAPSMDVDYRAFKFFDDEIIPKTVANETSLRYLGWKMRYLEVYDKFITNHSSRSGLPAVKIAILDTGLDLTHPDVEARAENIKDKYNWLNDKMRRAVHDRNGHGTFTTCLLLDYAPDAEIYVAKIADNTPSSPRIIAKAINHAVSVWNVDIISMSFGFPTCDVDGYDELECALKGAYASDTLLFAAASNSGGKLGRAFPAREPTVIAVHSTDTNGNRSAFSPTPAKEDANLATVGEAVESAWPIHLCDEAENPLYIKQKSGTSYATPIIVGIAAFLMLYVRIHVSDISGALKSLKRMKALLKKVAEKGPQFKPRDGYYFVDLSLYPDSLFGKDKRFIDLTFRDTLAMV